MKLTITLEDPSDGQLGSINSLTVQSIDVYDSERFYNNYSKHGIITIVDINGGSFSFANQDFSHSQNIYDWVSKYNALFLASSSPVAQGVSMSILNPPVQLTGSDFFEQTGTKYTTHLRVLKITSTKQSYIYKKNTNNYIERAFPFLNLDTIDRYKSESNQDQSGTFTTFWSNSLKTQSRYFLLPNDLTFRIPRLNNIPIPLGLTIDSSQKNNPLDSVNNELSVYAEETPEDKNSFYNLVQHINHHRISYSV